MTRGQIGDIDVAALDQLRGSRAARGGIQHVLDGDMADRDACALHCGGNLAQRQATILQPAHPSDHRLLLGDRNEPATRIVAAPAERRLAFQAILALPQRGRRQTAQHGLNRGEAFAQGGELGLDLCAPFAVIGGETSAAGRRRTASWIGGLAAAVGGCRGQIDAPSPLRRDSWLRSVARRSG